MVGGKTCAKARTRSSSSSSSSSSTVNVLYKNPLFKNLSPYLRQDSQKFRLLQI